MVIARTLLLLLAVCLSLVAAQAQPTGDSMLGRDATNGTSALLEFSVIPPNYAGTAGTATFVGPLASTPRTYQLLIHESLLTGLVGKNITALSWRIPANATSSWPATNTSFAAYDIRLSGSVAPSDRSLTFALNVVGPQTLVRSGALGVDSAAYPFGGSPNDWGPEITLTPWRYSGGHLLVEIRHAGTTATSRSNDAISTSTSGYGSLFSGAWQSGSTATEGLQGNFAVVRLTAEDSSAVSVGEYGGEVPSAFALDQNYPNPFNPSTTLAYALPVDSHVLLRVFDAVGREVTTIVNQHQAAGRYVASWDGQSSAGNPMASGLYFARLEATNTNGISGFRVERKMLLVK